MLLPIGEPVTVFESSDQYWIWKRLHAVRPIQLFMLHVSSSSSVCEETHSLRVTTKRSVHNQKVRGLFQRFAPAGSLCFHNSASKHLCNKFHPQSIVGNVTCSSIHSPELNNMNSTCKSTRNIALQYRHLRNLFYSNYPSCLTIYNRDKQPGNRRHFTTSQSDRRHIIFI